MRRLPALITLLIALLWSCAGEENADSEPADGNTSPTMVTDSVNSFVSDSGITRYHIEAPLWLMFDEADEPYWIFPDGLRLSQFDDRMNVIATMVADTARYFSRLKLWRLDGNVRMRRLNGEKFLTTQLFWNQNDHKVYSDSFIHIERPDRILEGYGFISNEQITAYTIRRPTGIFPTEGFTGGSPNQPSDSQPLSPQQQPQ